MAILVSDLSDTGLSDETILKIRSAFAKYPQIKTVILYGSRAKGEYRNGSDIDLTIKDSRVEYKDLLALELALDDLMTPYGFDISILENIENPALVEHIKRVGRVFYEADATKNHGCQ
jgi:predicted nucleotidyltransferase